MEQGLEHRTPTLHMSALTIGQWVILGGGKFPSVSPVEAVPLIIEYLICSGAGTGTWVSPHAG